MQRIGRIVLGSLLVFGCTSLEAPSGQAPGYVRAADHFRSFDTPAGLQAYLRAGSQTGPLVAALRGGTEAGYPEHALASFNRALRHGPVLIHAEVRLTQDGMPVLLRDGPLERTTSGQGSVREHSFAAVRSLLLRDAYGAITPFRVPTLEEALTWSRGRAILLLDVLDTRYLELVLDAVRVHESEGHVVVITHSVMDALHVGARAPEVTIAAQIGDLAELNAILAAGVEPSRLVAFGVSGEIPAEVRELAARHDIRVMIATYGETDERARTAGAAVYHALLERGTGILLTDEVSLASRAAASFHAILSR